MSVSLGLDHNRESVVISDASCGEYLLVVIDTTDTTVDSLVCKKAADGSVLYHGITLEPTTAADEPTTIATEGTKVPLKVDGSGTAISEGDELMADSSGRGIKATAGNNVIGYALQPSSAANDVILIHINRRAIPSG